MLRIQTWLLVLVLCTGSLEAWWFLNPETTTETAAETGTPGATTAAGTPGATTAAGTPGATTAAGTLGATMAAETSGAITPAGTLGATTATGTSSATVPAGTPDATTAAGTPGDTTPAGTSGVTTTANATKKKEDEEDDDISGVGEEIINVATGIRKFVEAWDATPTTWTTNGDLTEEVERANPNTTGNTDRFRGERVEEGSGIGVGDGSGSGFKADLGSDVESVMVLNGDKVMLSNLTGIIGDISQLYGTVKGVLESTLRPPDSHINSSDPLCLPVPSDWSICSGKQPKSFALPNFFNHTSVEEVGAVLQEWAWLTKEGCHHGAEWFLCLLLAPRCPLPAAPLHLPCRSFCQVLQDSCWASLENGHLPVECHLLPERAQEPGRPACVSVSNWKGNPGGLECILSADTF